jgi:hypothetical protein
MLLFFFDFGDDLSEPLELDTPEVPASSFTLEGEEEEMDGPGWWGDPLWLCPLLSEEFMFCPLLLVLDG